MAITAKEESRYSSRVEEEEMRGKQFDSFTDTAKPWHQKAHIITPQLWRGFYCNITLDGEPVGTFLATLFGLSSHVTLDAKFLGKRLSVERTTKKGSKKKARPNPRTKKVK